MLCKLKELTLLWLLCQSYEEGAIKRKQNRMKSILLSGWSHIYQFRGACLRYCGFVECAYPAVGLVFCIRGKHHLHSCLRAPEVPPGQASLWNPATRPGSIIDLYLSPLTAIHPSSHPLSLCPIFCIHLALHSSIHPFSHSIHLSMHPSSEALRVWDPPDIPSLLGILVFP